MSIPTPREAAHTWAKAGFSIIPIRVDGSKAPTIEWTEFQHRIMSTQEIDRHFAGDVGIGIVGGAVSGNLTIIDIESVAPQAELSALWAEHLPDFLSTLPQVVTPSGGRHVYVRCATVGRSVKLALRPKPLDAPEDFKQTMIETKAGGGYVLAPCSPPECHPDNKPYLPVGQIISKTPIVSAEKLDILLACCRSFNQVFKTEHRPASHLGASGSKEGRPGDDYNENGNGLQVLLDHGWQVVGRPNGCTYLCRPGKKTGISASFGKVAPNILYVFSSNAQPFDNERAYDAFGIYARLEHQGDWQAAARKLKDLGFGKDEPAMSKRIAVAEDPENSDESAKIVASLKNAVSQILERKMTDITYDDFLCRFVTFGREWTDGDDFELCIRLQHINGFQKIGSDITRQAAQTIGYRNRAHCVRDWLHRLTWDQEPRLDHFFQDHFGAPSNPYVQSCSKNFWLSMIARIYKPGCQSDHMVVLEGPQGIGKSSALRVIGGQWYCEQHENATNAKAFAEVIQGKLLVEISEMDSFNRSEVTRVKQIITNTTDRFRASYGYHATDFPRQSVFAGTTNRDDWNRDETGGRRFWPIVCTSIDLEALATWREQFFAEAVHRYKAGETWWEMPADLTQKEQESRYTEDPWSDLIEEFIRTKSKATIPEIMIECLSFEKARLGKSDQMRVSTCLRRLGWSKGKLQRDPNDKGSHIRFWNP